MNYVGSSPTISIFLYVAQAVERMLVVAFGNELRWFESHYWHISLYIRMIEFEMEKLPHYHFSWIVSFQKQRYHICEMLTLETKLSRGKLLPQSDLQGGSVSTWDVTQALRQEGVQLHNMQS